MREMATKGTRNLKTGGLFNRSGGLDRRYSAQTRLDLEPAPFR